MIFRITVRGKDMELRGRLDDNRKPEVLRQFAQDMKPWGVVVASPAVTELDLEPHEIAVHLERMRADERDGRVDMELALEVLQLAMDEIDRLRNTETLAKRLGGLVGYFAGQLDRVIDIHARVVMDSAEERDLHDRTVVEMRSASRKGWEQLEKLLPTSPSRTPQDDARP